MVNEELGGFGVVLAVRDVDGELGLPRDKTVTHVFRKHLVLFQLTQKRPETSSTTTMFPYIPNCPRKKSKLFLLFVKLVNFA